MRKKIIQNIDFIIILISLIISILFYYNLKGKIELPISILATGYSISVGLRHYKIENDKIFKELFIYYNEKYDAKYNNYLNDIIIKNEKNDLVFS